MEAFKLSPTINHIHDDLYEARRVLAIEAQALEALALSLEDHFSTAVDLILNTKGRVILTGMGKSGHVAHKIAATFASTGTPSYFVHPAEASHGDLGMIADQDLIVALSNSGETSELSDILAYAKRYKIPLIGLTTNSSSTLAQTADVALALPKVEEACPLGLAPTTSTTMMMALGDALATAVLRRRGFSAADFGSLHPGGKLGQKLLRVEKLMHQGNSIPLIQVGASMQDALIEMTSKGFGCLGVLDKEKQLLGVITDGDLRRHISSNLLEKKVEEIMTIDPFVIVADMLAHEALAILNERGITNLFVVDMNNHKKICGIVHVHDCLRAGLS